MDGINNQELQYALILILELCETALGCCPNPSSQFQCWELVLEAPEAQIKVDVEGREVGRILGGDLMSTAWRLGGFLLN